MVKALLIVEIVTGVGQAQVMSRSRMGAATRARWIAIHLLRRAGLSSYRIELLMKKDPVAVRYAIRQTPALAHADSDFKAQIELAEQLADCDLATLGRRVLELRQEETNPAAPAETAPEAAAASAAPPSRLPADRIVQLRVLGWTPRGISRQLGVPLDVVRFTVECYEREKDERSRKRIGLGPRRLGRAIYGSSSPRCL